MTKHHYQVQVEWTGNTGSGTSSYKAYSRNHLVSAPLVPAIETSADPAFLGDEKRWDPEQLLVASVSQCHMLWYLHLAAQHGIVVESYEDVAEGLMETEPSGAGQFTLIELNPKVTISLGDPNLAQELHHKVPEFCFIARSLNFPVRHNPEIFAA